MRDRARATAAGVAALLLTLPPEPAAATQCPNNQVVTGTAVTRAQLLRHGEVMPAEFIQIAALLAAIEPAQRDPMKAMAWQRLRLQGFDDMEPLFLVAYDDALAGQRAANTTRGILGGVAGAVVSSAVTGRIGDAVGGAMFGSMGAAMLPNAATSQLVATTLDKKLVDPVLDRLIRHPCSMTAAQALRELSVRSR